MSRWHAVPPKSPSAVPAPRRAHGFAGRAASGDWPMQQRAGVPTHEGASKISTGRVLVHNDVNHKETTPNGACGFRVWTQLLDAEGLRACDCGWSRLPHYRVQRVDHWKHIGPFLRRLFSAPSRRSFVNCSASDSRLPSSDRRCSPLVRLISWGCTPPSARPLSRWALF